MEEGSYAEALQELDVAVRLAELTSFASFLALSLSNRGETKLRMGRIDEALADLEASRLRYRQIDSDMVSYPLHADRRDLQRAREPRPGARHARGSSRDRRAVGRCPGRGPGARLPRDRGRRRGSRASTRARRPGGVVRHRHVVRRSRCSLRGGSPRQAATVAHARELAAQAESAARARHDRAGLADATRACRHDAREDQRVTSRRLAEAGAIWREIGNPLGEAKVDLVLASIDRGAGSAALRRKAERQLEALGVRAHQSGNVAAGLLAFLSPRDRRGGENPVARRLLGAARR